MGETALKRPTSTKVHLPQWSGVRQKVDPRGHVRREQSCQRCCAAVGDFAAVCKNGDEGRPSLWGYPGEENSAQVHVKGRPIRAGLVLKYSGP